jgi:hypothetical protein
MPPTEYSVEKCTFLPLPLPSFLSSISSFYFSLLLSAFINFLIYDLFLHTFLFLFSLLQFFCVFFVYLPTNIAVKWLSFQLHVPSSHLDGSLSWIRNFVVILCVPVRNAVVLATVTPYPDFSTSYLSTVLLWRAAKSITKQRNVTQKLDHHEIINVATKWKADLLKKFPPAIWNRYRRQE